MNSLTLDLVQTLYRYDPASGHFWHLQKTGICASKPGPAGSVCKDGYIIITIKKKHIYAHRLAWLFVYKAWPVKTIDHINGMKTDNRIQNLRDCSISENHRNKPVRKDNKAGIKGVIKHRKTSKYLAQIQHLGKKHYLGIFETAAEAQAAYRQKAVELHGEFARCQ